MQRHVASDRSARIARHLARLSRRDLVDHEPREADTRQSVRDRDAQVSSRRRNAPRVRALPPLCTKCSHSACDPIQLSRDDRRSGGRAFASHWNDDARRRRRRHVSVSELHVGGGRMFWSPDSEDAAVFFIALVVFLGRAGRVWGVDAYLTKRWPKSPLW